MMKIAVASEGNTITQHFGHCENFNIFDVQDEEIKGVESVPNPGHRPGFLPEFLNDLGVNVIISGGMGAGAIEIFREKDIKVVTGIHGAPREAAENYIKGRLDITDEPCKDHR
ncbi:MAG: dinitrogenase iron-molybdenum cofactor [Clostridiales bacterium]|nr:dinitrogenase iron-molybdenum cofactor [Clostridiales bacterium]